MNREEFYEVLDSYTGEIFEDEIKLHDRVGLTVVLPPLGYDGNFAKGLLYSASLDLITARFPLFRELFVCVANSMWTSYPWARSADAYFVSYENLHRSEWFRRTNPDRAHITHIPLQDADFTDEYLMAPVVVRERDIDLLCVSRLSSLKNLPFVARALKVYRQKYPFEPIRMTLIAGKPGAYASDVMSEMERTEYLSIVSILQHPEDYIDFVDQVSYEGMRIYYSRSRAVLLGSLIEGKNRSLNEAQSCNTPVICFNNLNKVARGNSEIFHDKAGMRADFDPEALADVIHEVLCNESYFKPRAVYISKNGRRRFLDRCIKELPYFRHSMPGYDSSNAWDNIWLDLAVQDNYGISLHNYLYGRRPWHSWAAGLDAVGQLATFYREKFEL
jgi:glycosyltransferase involved in cell wall biosynthesis